MHEKPIHENQGQKSVLRKPGVWLLLLLIGMSGFAWMRLSYREPVYQGKPLSYWLEPTVGFNPFQREIKNGPPLVDATNAIRSLGTKSIPYLLRLLRASDSTLKTRITDFLESHNFTHVPFFHPQSASQPEISLLSSSVGSYNPPSIVEQKKAQAWFGFIILGSLATNAIPDLKEIYAHPSSYNSKSIADSMLRRLYPLPGAAIPDWIPLKDRAQWYVGTARINYYSGIVSNAVTAFSEAVKLNPTNEYGYVDPCFPLLQIHDYLIWNKPKPQ